jgi:hypothetical protein
VAPATSARRGLSPDSSAAPTASARAGGGRDAAAIIVPTEHADRSAPRMAAAFDPPGGPFRPSGGRSPCTTFRRDPGQRLQVGFLDVESLIGTGPYDQIRVGTGTATPWCGRDDPGHRRLRGADEMLAAAVETFRPRASTTTKRTTATTPPARPARPTCSPSTRLQLRQPAEFNGTATPSNATSTLGQLNLHAVAVPLGLRLRIDFGYGAHLG